MAMNHKVDMSSRRTALESFAGSFGVHPPREPIPAWWHHFEKWFNGAFSTQADQDASKFVRTEAFFYEDESDEGDDDDDDEVGSDDEDLP